MSGEATAGAEERDTLDNKEVAEVKRAMVEERKSRVAMAKVLEDERMEFGKLMDRMRKEHEEHVRVAEERQRQDFHDTVEGLKNQVSELKIKQAEAEKKARTYDVKSDFHRDSKTEASKCEAMVQALEGVITAQETMAAKRGEKRPLPDRQSAAEGRMIVHGQQTAVEAEMSPAKLLKPAVCSLGQLPSQLKKEGQVLKPMRKF